MGSAKEVASEPDDSQPVRQTYVDKDGSASLTGLASGYYSLLVQDTSGRAAFLDSLYSDGDALPATRLGPKPLADSLDSQTDVRMLRSLPPVGGGTMRGIHPEPTWRTSPIRLERVGWEP